MMLDRHSKKILEEGHSSFYSHERRRTVLRHLEELREEASKREEAEAETTVKNYRERELKVELKYGAYEKSSAVPSTLEIFHGTRPTPSRSSTQVDAGEVETITPKS